MSTNVNDEQTNTVDSEKSVTEGGSGVQIETPLDLNSNPQARIRNPLEGIPRSHLLRNVEAFAQEKELTHVLPSLKKGAVRKYIYILYCQSFRSSFILPLVAQNPVEFETLDLLDDKDRDAIRYERGHRWSHPWTLYVTVFLCSVGAATQYARHFTWFC